MVDAWNPGLLCGSIRNRISLDLFTEAGFNRQPDLSSKCGERSTLQKYMATTSDGEAEQVSVFGADEFTFKRLLCRLARSGLTPSISPKLPDSASFYVSSGPVAVSKLYGFLQ